MTEDITHDLGVGACVDLSGGVTVAQHVPADRDLDPGRARVLPYEKTDG